MTWLLWVLGIAAVVFLTTLGTEQYKISRRKRNRKDLQHILGIEQWWGRR